MAAVAVGIMFMVNASRSQSSGAVPVGAATGSTTSAQPSKAAPSAAAIPAAAVETKATFLCGSSTLTARQSPQTAFVSAFRTGTHPGYDRLTVEFKNRQPGVTSIRPQTGTTFNQSPSGQPVKLAGRNGILVIVRGSDAHSAFSGLRDIKTRFPNLVEVRVLEDFEGQVSLGLGLSQTACYRASVLTNPTRLLIDIRSGE